MNLPILVLLVVAVNWHGQLPVPPLPVPGHGEVHLVLPATWKEVRRELPVGRPPSMAVDRMGMARGSLELTVIWDPKGDPGFARPGNVRSLTLKGQVAVRGQSVEKDFPLLPILGTAGQGFYYVATDQTYKLPASGVPVAGEYPILTHGELGLGTVVVSFTIFSDGKDDAAVKEALAALRGAVLVTEPRGPSEGKAPREKGGQ